MIELEKGHAHSVTQTSQGLMALIVMLVLLALVIVYCCWGSCCNIIRRRRRRLQGDATDVSCSSSVGRCGSWRPPAELGTSTSNHIHEHHHHHHAIPAVPAVPATGAAVDTAVTAPGKSRNRGRPALLSPPPYDLLFGQVLSPKALKKLIATESLTNIRKTMQAAPKVLKRVIKQSV